MKRHPGQSPSPGRRQRVCWTLTSVQKSLAGFGLDGWLLYDFRGERLARRVLGLDQKPAGTRRFFYLVRPGGPAQARPPDRDRRARRAAGRQARCTSHGRSWRLAWRRGRGCRRVAMEYAPRVRNPISRASMPATIELVRSTGVEVVSSADLIQQFEATWDDEQWQMHLQAERLTTAAYELAWALIAERVRAGGRSGDRGPGRHHGSLPQHGMTTYSPPIVGVTPTAATRTSSPYRQRRHIDQGDFVLIDLWAKLDHPRSVYSDLTRVGYVGERVPERYEKIFRIVAAARDAAIAMRPGRQCRRKAAPRAGKSTTPAAA